MAIKHTKRHANNKGIEPLNPKTWDDGYRKRQQELAGIKDAIKKFEKGLNEMNKRIRARK